MGEFKASQFLNRFIQDDQGQSITEYILVLSVTIVGGAALARAIMGSLDKGILNLGAQLEKDLKTGKASLNVWQN